MKIKNAYKKTKDLVMKFVHLKYHKYIIVMVLGVLLLGFVGDNSLVAHMRYKSRIRQLQAEIATHNAMTKANLEQLYLLQNDVKTVERVGRERYFMKRPDEVIFVLSDDSIAPQTPTGHETVE